MLSRWNLKTMFYHIFPVYCINVHHICVYIKISAFQNCFAYLYTYLSFFFFLNRTVIAKVEECSHPIVMKGLCAECGQDLTQWVYIFLCLSPDVFILKHKNKKANDVWKAFFTMFFHLSLLLEIFLVVCWIN